MSSDVNVWAGTARLAADPELKGEAQAVLSLRLAVGKRVKNGETWDDGVDWFDASVLGAARAQGLAGFLKKGSRVAISGRLEQRQWEQEVNGETVKRSAVSIIVNELTPLDKKADGEAPASADAPAKADGDGGYFE